MAILTFQKPDKVIMIEGSEFEGNFEFRPLEPGYGITIGNSIRRVLLNSLEGFAFTSVKIEGTEHEFDSITGVVEDVTQIILNLKQVRLKRQVEDAEEEKVHIRFSGKSEFKAGDIEQYMSNFKVLNPDVLICELEPTVELVVELTISKGRGYVPAEENVNPNATVGTIAIDSIFTPIKNVKFSVENYRVEQKTDYENLKLSIITDGSIHPKDALNEAAKILIYHFNLFSDGKITLDTDEKDANEEFDETSLHMRQLLKTKLVDMDLSVRALNCLKAAEVATLGELVSFNKNDLLKFRNFGKKSLAELDDLVKSKNLRFGMNVSIYKLDKE